MAEKDPLNSPNLYADTRDDIAELYPNRSNDNRDYGSRPASTTPQVDAVPTPVTTKDEQLSLWREQPQAMKDALRKAKEMGERAAQRLPLFPETRSREQADQDFYDAHWREQSRKGK